MILRNLERQPGRTFVSVVGIAFAVAVLFVGLAFIDVMDELINQQFSVAMRQDATVSFVEPRSGRAVHAVEHLPGVMDIEPMRSVPVRLRAGHRSRTLAITGLPRTPHLNRVVDRGDSRAVAAGRRSGPVENAGRHPRRRARAVAAGRSARRRTAGA